MGCAQGDEQKEDEEFAIVFAAMGVNMETAHFFKQVCSNSMQLSTGLQTPTACPTLNCPLQNSSPPSFRC